MERPESAVAYDEDVIAGLCEEIGFVDVEIVSDPDGRQRQSLLRASTPLS